MCTYGIGFDSFCDRRLPTLSFVLVVLIRVAALLRYTVLLSWREGGRVDVLREKLGPVQLLRALC